MTTADEPTFHTLHIVLFFSVFSKYHCFLNITSSSLIIIIPNLPAGDYFCFFILDFLYFNFLLFKLTFPYMVHLKFIIVFILQKKKKSSQPYFQRSTYTYKTKEHQNHHVSSTQIPCWHFNFFQIKHSLKCFYLSHPNRAK